MVDAICGNCKHDLREVEDADGTNAPCPECGSTTRTHSVLATDDVVPSDHLAALQKRDNEPIGFSESERQGRSSSGAAIPGKPVVYAVEGTAPQGEEDTLQACQILIKKFNSMGGNWGAAGQGQEPADCKATDRDESGKALEIQVVRASTDRRLWQTLNLTHKFAEPGTEPSELAMQMRNAIEKKATDRRIPAPQRKDLILALDATRLPGHALAPVVASFRDNHALWAGALGFKQIWLVGPNIELTWRLDHTV